MYQISFVLSIALWGCKSKAPVSGDEEVQEPERAKPMDRSGKVTDIFAHTVHTPMVDVLWVIDGSGSMQQDLQFLAEHFPSFVQTIDNSSVDYHVAVTGTDPQASGVLLSYADRKWIDRDTTDPIAAFLSMVDAAGNGGSSGYNFDTTHACLHHETGDCVTSGFRRDDAPIHTIVVTDEGKTSDLGGPEFVQWYRQLDDYSPNRRFSGILDLKRTAAYVDAIHQIGGVVRDVTIADWDELLQDFALQMRSSAETREFPLSRFPVPESISVEVRPAPPAPSVETPNLEEDLWLYDPIKNSVIVWVQDIPEGPYLTFLRYQARTSRIE